MAATEGERSRCCGFSHEALFYAGADDFATRCGAFVREGLALGEPVLAMLVAGKIELLRDELGAAASGVTFVDMGEAGRNPGRIISRWSDFATAVLAAGRGARGIGEPVWAGRSQHELVECQLHEALINLALARAAGMRLLCPYDTEALPASVIEEARRSHPLIVDREGRRASSSYRRERALDYHRDRLPPPDRSAIDVGFQQATLDSLRRVLRDRATDEGLAPARVDDFVVAANEAATNSVRHGGGSGVLRLWSSDGALVCEIRDGGRIDDPATGRLRPADGARGGHGVWLAHQLCDLVQLRSSRRGTVVRLHMRTGG